MTDKKQTRAIWPLLRARVAKRTDTGCELVFGPEYGSPTRITIPHDMRGYDVREGDLLTLYTEVLLKPAEGQG